MPDVENVFIRWRWANGNVVCMPSLVVYVREIYLDLKIIRSIEFPSAPRLKSIFVFLFTVLYTPAQWLNGSMYNVYMYTIGNDKRSTMRQTHE